MTSSTGPHPLRKTYHPIRTIEDLATHLQWALSVELATIPPYLCALYSIKDASSTAYDVIRSVVVEEMLHTMLVSNMMNAIGAHPSLGPEYIASYPGFIPHHAAGGPFIQLQAFSPELARVTFMAIEQPEPSPRVPAEGDQFRTIGQFYKAIEEGFEACVKRFGEREVFGRDTGFQRDDTYFGGGGGRLLTVHDLESARTAIREITDQGEGSPVLHPPTPGEEPYGGYEHYGIRLDGTYGPILGTAWELSHYRKFKQLADGELTVSDVYPMQANPAAAPLEGDVRALSDLFNGSYTLVLRALERAFNSDTVPVNFYAVAFPVMRVVLPALATLLMRTTLNPQADADLGPTAGPGFVYLPTPLPDLIRQANQLQGQSPDRGDDYQKHWRRHLGLAAQVLGDAHRAAERGGSEILRWL
jgi:hypothetical protein